MFRATESHLLRELPAVLYSYRCKRCRRLSATERLWRQIYTLLQFHLHFTVHSFVSSLHHTVFYHNSLKVPVMELSSDKLICKWVLLWVRVQSRSQRGQTPHHFRLIPVHLRFILDDLLWISRNFQLISIMLNFLPLPVHFLPLPSILLRIDLFD